MPEKPPSVLSERIRATRQRLGTQKLVAQKLGISEGHLRHLEAGRTDNPALELLVKLAELSGESLDYLARGVRAPPIPTNGDLLGRINQVVARVYREEQITLSELELGRVAAREYDDAHGVAADQWPAVLHVLEQRLRREIRTEDMGRREASG